MGMEMDLAVLVETILLMSGKSEKDSIVTECFLASCLHGVEPDWASMESLDQSICACCIELYEAVKQPEHFGFFQSKAFQAVLLKHGVILNNNKFKTLLNRLGFIREGNRKLYINPMGWTQFEIAIFNSSIYILFTLIVIFNVLMAKDSHLNLITDFFPIYLFLGFNCWLYFDCKLSEKININHDLFLSVISNDDISFKLRNTLKEFSCVHPFVYKGDLIDVENSICSDYLKLKKLIKSLKNSEVDWLNEIKILESQKLIMKKDLEVIRLLIC